MEIMPTVAQRNQRQHSRTMKNDLCTVFSRELRREIRLDALPSLLELEDALALLLEAVVGSRGARDLDPDLQLLLLNFLKSLDSREFVPFAQVTRGHRGGAAWVRVLEKKAPWGWPGWGLAGRGVCMLLWQLSSKTSHYGHGSGRAVICGLACLSGGG